MMFDQESEFISNYKVLYVRIDNLYWKRHRNWYLKFKKYEDEVFKEIEGYLGFYFISNYGQVISFHKKHPISRRYNFHNACFSLKLWLMCRSKHYYIHDLVYTHFCKPLKPGYKVIHRNRITTDNYYKNLISTKVFPIYVRLKERGFDFTLYHLIESESILKKERTLPVIQFDKEGKFMKKYPSLKVASIETLVNLSLIIRCLKNRQKTAGGYQWKYKDDSFYDSNGTIKKIDPVKYKKPPSNPHERKIIQFDLEGNFINEFSSIRKAARVIGTKHHVLIKKCADGNAYSALGFQWRYKNDPIFLKGKYKIAPIKRKRTQKEQPEQPVLQFSLKGKLIKEYVSINEAIKHNKKMPKNSVINCLKGRQKTAYGYQWLFKKEIQSDAGIKNIASVEMTTWKSKGPVLQFTLEGKFIKEFSSIKRAVKKAGIDYKKIQCACNKKRIAGDFQWRYKKDLLRNKGEFSIPPYIRPLNANLQPVIQLDLNGNSIKEYQSVAEAVRTLKISRTSLDACLDNESKTAGGFRWKRKKRKRELPELNTCNNDPVKKKRPNYKKSIVQFDLYGNFIKEYTSVNAASAAFNLKPETIRACIKGRAKTAAGFQWKYKETITSKDDKEKLKIEPLEKICRISHVEVVQFDLKGKFIRKFRNINDASKTLGIPKALLRLCIYKKIKTSGGFQWLPIDDPRFENGIIDIPGVKPKLYSNAKRVLQYTPEGNFVKEYHSIGEAARQTGITKERITECANKKSKTAGRFVWKYKKN